MKNEGSTFPQSMCFLTKLVLMGIIFVLSFGTSGAKELRCGWYSNPSSGNTFLTDAQATWSITSQNEAAGKDAVHADKAPNFSPKQFVETGIPNTGYGYGCACLKVKTESKSHRITAIYSGKILPLDTCKKDKHLPPPF